jgi:hypothetical protein
MNFCLIHLRNISCGVNCATTGDEKGNGNLLLDLNTRPSMVKATRGLNAGEAPPCIGVDVIIEIQKYSVVLFNICVWR